MSYLAFLQTTSPDTISEAAKATGSAQEAIVGMLQGFWARLPYIAVGLAVFIVFLFLAWVVRKAVRFSVQKAGFDLMIASLVARIAYFAVALLGFFIASVVIFDGLTPGDLIAGLGIGSVALGFAFKDVLQNLFAGFLILLYRPFSIGDQIKIKDFEGVVTDISVRATNIKTLDGEKVVIPNSELYMNAVLVRTAFDTRRTDLVIGIGYDDDIEEARGLIKEILENNEVVADDPAPTIQVVELGDSAVNLQAKFWTKSKQGRVSDARDQVMTAVKYKLDEHKIDMPFPHMVVLNPSTD